MIERKLLKVKNLITVSALVAGVGSIAGFAYGWKNAEKDPGALMANPLAQRAIQLSHHEKRLHDAKALLVYVPAGTTPLYGDYLGVGFNLLKNTRSPADTFPRPGNARRLLEPVQEDLTEAPSVQRDLKEVIEKIPKDEFLETRNSEKFKEEIVEIEFTRKFVSSLRETFSQNAMVNARYYENMMFAFLTTSMASFAGLWISRVIPDKHNIPESFFRKKPITRTKIPKAYYDAFKE
jgi:hypothetical protein